MRDAGFGKATKIINVAVGSFPVELGKEVQRQRTAAGLPLEGLAQILKLAGLQTESGDLKQLEAGQGPEPDLRLLTALVFTLEISLDRVVTACLRQASTEAASGSE